MQEATRDEQLQAAIENYTRIAAETAYQRHGGQEGKFEEYFDSFVKNAEIELSQDNALLIDGDSVDLFVGRTRRRPGIEESFFNLAGRKKLAESSQPQPGSSQQKQASPKTQEPECLYVSKAQLMSREFMLAAGVELTAGIQSGKIRVDDSRAVQNGHEIREFLSPQVVEPAAQKTEIKPAPKTSTISKAQLLDRNFLRKVDAEWSSEGGYLRAVQRGDIRIE